MPKDVRCPCSWVATTARDDLRRGDRISVGVTCFRDIDAAGAIEGDAGRIGEVLRDELNVISRWHLSGPRRLEFSATRGGSCPEVVPGPMRMQRERLQRYLRPRQGIAFG